MDEGDGGRQYRRDTELLAHLLLDNFQSLIDGFDRGLEEGDNALLGQYVLCSVPLVHVNGVNGTLILIGARGAHIGEQTFSGRYARFAQPQQPLFLKSLLCHQNQIISL